MGLNTVSEEACAANVLMVSHLASLKMSMRALLFLFFVV